MGKIDNVAQTSGSGTASAPSGPGGDTELSSHERVARIEAVSTRGAALIGVVGVILAALLSFGSALISANLTSKSSAKLASQQLTGEVERSRSEFSRTQKQTAYLAVVVDQQNLTEVYDAMVKNLLDSAAKETAPSAKYDTNEERAVGLSAKLGSSDKALIEITSDDATQLAYAKLLEAQAARELTLGREHAACAMNKPGNTDSCYEADNTQASVAGEVAEAYAEVIQQFKRELLK